MANVDRGVYQKKIQRQKRASASAGRKGCQAWGGGQKGMLLREAGGGRYRVESKTWISTDKGSETLGDAGSRLKPHLSQAFEAWPCGSLQASNAASQPCALCFVLKIQVKYKEQTLLLIL